MKVFLDSLSQWQCVIVVYFVSDNNVAALLKLGNIAIMTVILFLPNDSVHWNYFIWLFLSAILWAVFTRWSHGSGTPG